MFDSDRIKQDFSDAAMQYDAHAKLQQRVLVRLLEKAGSKISAVGNILDAGCGTGQLASLLAPRRVIGLDLAHAMCARATKAGAAAVNGTLESLPFANASFDAVFSSLALQWVHEWQGAVKEMNRVLKPGGILALSTFGDGTLEELKESFASGDRHPHVSWFMPREKFQHEEIVTEYFPDLAAIMRHLKAIGARNKLINQRKSLMTKRQLSAVEDHYRKHFGTEQGLPVTWKILYSVTVKT